MGKSRAAILPSENLTVSRIHVVLRPFETKLNVLAKTLERKIAEDRFAPKTRQPGVTYAKRHRIRAMTGMSARQAGRAYALEKSKGLPTLYNFHEQVIGVEDAFRNLIRGIPSPDRQRIPSLQALVSKMIGMQVAEETLRDKDELEKEGVDDCIGLWYGGLAVHSRKDALVAHAVQLVELKIPVFIIELWRDLLTTTLEAKLHQESCILLEYILLYYFTPNEPDTPSSSRLSDLCPVAAVTSRELTDLYSLFTTHLPAADFFSILLPVLHQSPIIIWNIRALKHLIRSIDNDMILSTRLVECMASAWLSSSSDPLTRERTAVLAQVETKCLNLLILLFTIDTTSIEKHLLYEIALLSTTLHELSKQGSSSPRLYELVLALDTLLLHFMTKYSEQDASNVLGCLSHTHGPLKPLTSAFSLLIQICRAFGLQSPIMDKLRGGFPMHDRDGITNQIVAVLADTLCYHNLPSIADSLETRWTEMQENLDESDLSSFRLGISGVDTLEQDSLKRRLSHKMPTKRKRFKTTNGTSTRRVPKQAEEEELEEMESDSSDSHTSEWSNSVSSEDTAGEQETESSEHDSDDSVESTNDARVSCDSTEGDRTVVLDTSSNEEEQKSEVENSVVISTKYSPSKTSDEEQDNTVTQSARKRILQIYSSGPSQSRPPVLRSVFHSKASLLLKDETLPKYTPILLGIQSTSRQRHNKGVSRAIIPSSDDDLDLLAQREWSSP
ncbi:hypothetical protein CPB86DRAFT_781411 [Serendipita vermifera]|nr:hypothetical protein CPB86DRAFT_781411 [Serendipita vermifera]